MTNLVCNLLFLITAMAIIAFDLKVQKIPIILVLINYSLFSYLINPLLLVGNIAILILWKLDKPIDFIYILALCYNMIMFRNLYSPLCLIPLVIQIVLSKREKISFMVAIEISCIMVLLLRLLKIN